MLDLPFRTTSAITTPVADVVRRAKHAVWGTNPVHLNQRDDDAILGFGTDAPVRTLSPSQIITFPAALEMVTAALHRVKGTYPDIPAKTLFLDIETHNAGREYDMPLEDFFRLGQYGWGWNGDIVLTTDLADVLAQMEEADLIVAHNGLGFDFRVLLGNSAIDYAHQRKLLDTFVLGNLVFPAPDTFTMRNGHRQSQGDSPSGTMKWLSLDNLCFQLNVGGKEGDLKALARMHNPPKTKTEDLDFSLIPVDDPDFLAYARQDIVSLRDVTRDILNARPMQEYDWRDHMRTAIDAQMTINGILLDRDLAQARVDELAAKRGELLTRLSADYDFPTTGKMPWRSSVGKDAIFKILSDNGITLFTRPNWKRSEKTGVPSLGGEVLVQITEGTDAEELGTMLAQLMGQRPLAQQALDYCAKDGRVHCSYSGLQRSGRRSSTKVGLTTWTARGPGAEEKAYFIAPPGHSMLEMDLSNADQRIVAALSGDREYAKRFEEGVDGHEINGRLMFGDRLYDTDPAHHRDLSKPAGHALPYGAGVNKLHETANRKLADSDKIPLENIQRFVDGFMNKYPGVAKWMTKVREEGESGWVTNAWGRRMPIGNWTNPKNGEVKSRSWTQSPALHGQSGTNEILTDGLISMYEYDKNLILWLSATIHDAILMTVPDEFVGYVQKIVPELVEQKFRGIDFPLESGKPASNWYAAGH